jgi:DNA-directed RNA polymerase subunit RPC12/RpoP
MQNSKRPTNNEPILDINKKNNGGGRKMKCKCPKCEHEWEYKGQATNGQKASCPMCQSKVLIEGE